MKKFILSSLALMLLAIVSTGTLLAQTTPKSASDAILGDWINAEKDASFLIYKQNGKYFGKITWGTGRDTKDIKNPDASLRSRDLVGLTILTDFEYDGDNVWDEGKIYDPKSGDTFSCKMTLTDNKTLEVRGYMGFSLFGRTETWTRK